MLFSFTEALRRAHDAGMGCSLKGDETGVIYFLGQDHKKRLLIKSVSPRTKGKGEWRDEGAPCRLEDLEGEYEIVPLPWSAKPRTGPSIAELFPELKNS